MSFNKNWDRWLRASTRKHFDNLKQTVPLYIEGTDRDTTDLQDFAEFRMDGPRIKELSKDYFRLEVTINILVTSIMDDTDIDKIDKTIGVMVAAFTPTINVLKYGDGPDDDDSFLDCLLLSIGRNDILRVNHFGQVERTNRVLQATVEGKYTMTLGGS